MGGGSVWRRRRWRGCCGRHPEARGPPVVVVRHDCWRGRRRFHSDLSRAPVLLRVRHHRLMRRRRRRRRHGRGRRRRFHPKADGEIVGGGRRGGRRGGGRLGGGDLLGGALPLHRLHRLRRARERRAQRDGRLCGGRGGARRTGQSHTARTTTAPCCCGATFHTARRTRDPCSFRQRRASAGDPWNSGRPGHWEPPTAVASRSLPLAQAVALLQRSSVAKAIADLKTCQYNIHDRAPHRPSATA